MKSAQDGPLAAPRVWPVGALCKAIAQALEAHFNPVTVTGELSGFTRATSGHCYFVLKDAVGQLRCAMFRRAASMLDFSPQDGARVELQGRLGVYEARGELQLVVESMRPAGQGNLLEQFLQTKARLQAQGLFDSSRKRTPSPMPRAIAVVTSLGAAAWHDVMTTLQRRVPHVPVILVPSLVQGDGAPAALVQALEQLYQWIASPQAASMAAPIDTILLVRGGGSLEDLWAFNDERLAYTLARSPVPLICGVGHETDFSIADFVADLRAPTPTAAAELASASTEFLLQTVDDMHARLHHAVQRQLDQDAQNLDRVTARLGRPSTAVHRAQTRLHACAQALVHHQRAALRQRGLALDNAFAAWPKSTQTALKAEKNTLARLALRLASVDPQLVLQRGYARLSDAQGRTIAKVADLKADQEVIATLVDGHMDLKVVGIHPH
jgi:exodeoxyribonuclease VII large subunit